MTENDLQLSIADIATIKNVIDLACVRGAIQANEMATVGQLYNRLTQFLELAIQTVNNESQPQGENYDS
jgi:hypothetical protein